MPLYAFTAVDLRGNSIKGEHEAVNLLDLEARLKRTGLDLIHAKIASPRFSLQRKKVQRIDLITFFFNLEQLTRAGVPLLEALVDLRDCMEHPHFRAILAHLSEALESGKTLSQAMAQHPNAFDVLVISLIKSGEASGQLPLIFQHLTATLKWQDELAAQTKNLLLYPLFIAASVTAITFFLMIYLVPQLVGFIQGMGKEVPMQTQILFATSLFFVNYWPLILAMPLIIFTFFKSMLYLYPSLHYHIDALKLRLWFIGPVFRKIILARFAHSFALLYGAGINILDCLAHLRNIANNQVIARGLTDVIHEIESGKNLSHSFAQAQLFPPLVLRMLKVGETTGQLDQALLNISYFYDRDVKDSIKRVQVMIEPLMTIILGGLLGWVMLSVLSPIYDLISQLKF